MSLIRAVPLEYNGVYYRSSLEGDWAAMFTDLDVYFQYEPQPWRMPSGAVYDCDFYLPTLNTYCEAKGPHNERLWKPVEFAAALAATEFPRAFQVVILRPRGPRGEAAWESADTRATPLLALCPGCANWGFTDLDDDGRYCRRCGCYDVLTDAYRSGSDGTDHHTVISMARAPRRAGAA